MTTAEIVGVIVVDVQGDFLEVTAGSLAVCGTDSAYINRLNEHTQRLKKNGFSIYATQDWHPHSHVSFFTNHAGKKAFDVVVVQNKDQVLWPPHCVQNTPGAEIMLDKNLFKAIVRKGLDAQHDSYSGFKDDRGQKTELNKLLKQEGIQKVVVYGIATDYCVKATAFDAIDAGYTVFMVKTLSRGVSPETEYKALAEMKAQGVHVLEDLDMERILSA